MSLWHNTEINGPWNTNFSEKDKTENFGRKHSFPIDVTLWGIEIDFNDKQCEKQLFSNEERE